MKTMKKLEKKNSVNLHYVTKCKVVLNHEPYEPAKDIIASVQKRPNRDTQSAKKIVAIG